MAETVPADVRWALPAPVEVAMPETGIASVTLREGDGQTVVAFAMAEGADMASHASSRAAVISVTHGRIRVTAGDTTHDLDPGGAVAMPPRTAHALHATRPSRFLLILAPRPA